jgi:hypothetical protein
MASSSDAAEVRRAHRTELSPLRFLERSVLVYPGKWPWCTRTAATPTGSSGSE